MLPSLLLTTSPSLWNPCIIFSFPLTSMPLPCPKYHHLFSTLHFYLVTQQPLLQTLSTLQPRWSFKNPINHCIPLLQTCLWFPTAFIIKPKSLHPSCQALHALAPVAFSLYPPLGFPTALCTSHNSLPSPRRCIKLFTTPGSLHMLCLLLHITD